MWSGGRGQAGEHQLVHWLGGDVRRGAAWRGSLALRGRRGCRLQAAAGSQLMVQVFTARRSAPSEEEEGVSASRARSKRSIGISSLRRTAHARTTQPQKITKCYRGSLINNFHNRTVGSY